MASEIVDPTGSAATIDNDATAGKSQSAAMLVQLTTDGIPKLHCPVCNKALISLSGYVKHVKKHEPPGGFHCRYCEARYCSDDELKRHRNSVHTIIACRICKDMVTFTSETEYREHIRIVHNGIDREMLKCDKCGAEYKTIDPYRRHMETQCGTIKPHKCDQCPMSFVTKYNLKQHKESHSGERKFCCSYCGKNFLQKGRLVEHERSHTGEKPYKCDVCGKCFAHRESIVTHSSIHSGIRLVECKCCSLRFSCYSNLIKHRRTRPDTCGLPAYDPPKNRVRMHHSRIPPTLNPTSEIKVSSLNKIIKPGDKEQQQIKKSIQKQSNGEKAAARKRTGGPARKPGRKKKVQSDTEEDATTTDDSDDADFIGTVPKRKTQKAAVVTVNGEILEHVVDELANSTPLSGITSVPTTNTEHQLKAIPNATTDSEEDYIDFDPIDSDESDAVPKVNIKREKAEREQESPLITKETEFETLNHTQYVDAAFNVKTEYEVNIFNEKDKLLDCILNEDDGELSEFVGDNISPGKYATALSNVKMEHDILDETEVILIKDEDMNALSEEDVLDVRESGDENATTNCKIILEDITKRYPGLKDEDSIRVGRRARPFFRLSKKRTIRDDGKPVRKYRKRGEAKEDSKDKSPAKRVAKISHQELKQRLKLLKKEEKSWSCPHCIKMYHMRKPFEKHLRDDHKLAEDEIKLLLKTDELGVHNEDVFKCHICEKIYLVEKRLLAHLTLHGPNGDLVFKCPCYCNTYFASKEAATTHAQQEHRELLYCQLCEKFMTGHDSLKNHMKNYHQNHEVIDLKGPRTNAKRNLVCDKCGKKFTGRTSLTDHVRSDCGRKPLYQCNICGKHLTTAGILKTHLLLHKDDTPYQCDQCGKTFKVKAQYKTHIKTRHTDFKPFKCHLCPKAYPYRESLLTHMTVHTGIKRFLCNGCGKRFTCISNLQAHRKVHADSCGQLPLNAKATQYMGVQKGNLLLGAKPEAGLDYIETNTLVAREVLDRDVPMAQELNFPSEPSAPLATVPLNYSQPATAIIAEQTFALPQMMAQFIDDSHQSQASSEYN